MAVLSIAVTISHVISILQLMGVGPQVGVLGRHAPDLAGVELGKATSIVIARNLDIPEITVQERDRKRDGTTVKLCNTR